MTRVVLSRALWCTLACFSVNAGGQGREPARQADRDEVALMVLPDGSMDVRETVTQRAFGRDVTWFERDVPADRVDGFIDVSASLDGRLLKEGEGPGLVRVRRSRSLQVRWQFPPMSGAHTLVLHYRAMGVVALEGNRGALRWAAWPPDRPGSASLRMTLTVPRGAVLLADPAVSDGGGWRVMREDDRWVAEKADAAPRERVIVTAEFAVDSLSMAEPTWQVNAERASEFRPALLAASGCLLLVGLGVVAMVRWRYPTALLPAPDVAPPLRDVMPPALATALIRSAARARWSIPAAIFGLAERGLVTFTEVDRAQPAGARAFVVTMRRRDDLQRHERVIADAWWLHARNGELDWRKALRRLRAVRSPFGRAVTEDLITAGLADRDRVTAAHGLRVSGFVVLGLGAVSAAATVPAVATYGVSVFAMPASVALVGVVFLIASARMPVRTAAGVRASAAWRERAREVGDGPRGAAGATARSDRDCPFSVAVGLGRGMVWVDSRRAAIAADPSLMPWLETTHDRPGAAAALAACD